ncbi:MAG: nucleoside triphosphate pyrophosphatase [Patescibacteria group bacterium]
MEKRIILASGSEARRKLLENIKLDFEIQQSDFEEIMNPDIPPEQLAVELALGKARDVAAKNTNAVIIAADSFVVLDGEYLGKPHSAEEARAVLRKISGKKQNLVTGMAVIDTESGATITDFEIGEIWVKELTDEEIEGYIKTGEPFGRAAGYAIQEIGSIFIEKIQGNYTGIIGLPVNKVYKILTQLGVKVI